MTAIQAEQVQTIGCILLLVLIPITMYFGYKAKQEREQK